MDSRLCGSSGFSAAANLVALTTPTLLLPAEWVRNRWRVSCAVLLYMASVGPSSWPLYLQHGQESKVWGGCTRYLATPCVPVWLPSLRMILPHCGLMVFGRHHDSWLPVGSILKVNRGAFLRPRLRYLVITFFWSKGAALIQVEGKSSLFSRKPGSEFAAISILSWHCGVCQFVFIDLLDSHIGRRPLSLGLCHKIKIKFYSCLLLLIGESIHS